MKATRIVIAAGLLIAALGGLAVTPTATSDIVACLDDTENDVVFCAEKCNPVTGEGLPTECHDP